MHSNGNLNSRADETRKTEGKNSMSKADPVTERKKLQGREQEADAEHRRSYSQNKCLSKLPANFKIFSVSHRE